MRKMNFFNTGVGVISTPDEQQNSALHNIPIDRLEERLSFWVLHNSTAEGKKLTIPQTLELCEIIDIASRASILPLAVQGKLRSLVWDSAEDSGACYYDNRPFYTLLRKIYVGVYSIQPDAVPYWKAVGKSIDAAIKHLEITPAEYNIAVAEVERANVEIQNAVYKSYGRYEQIQENTQCIGHELGQLTVDKLQEYSNRKAAVSDVERLVPERRDFVHLALSIAEIMACYDESMQEELQRLNQEATNLYITNKLNSSEYQILTVFCSTMIKNPLYSNRLDLRGAAREASDALRDYAIWYGCLRHGEMSATVEKFERMFNTIYKRNQSGDTGGARLVISSLQAYVPPGLTNAFMFFRRLATDPSFCIDTKF